MHIWIGLLLVGGGLFSIAGAIFNWNWFMESRKARWIVRLFGRGGARAFYAVLGTVVAVVGILLLAGVIRPPE